jgi:hypothetical protein
LPRLLATSKIVFSASLQETLGISAYEGALLNSIPMVPDRLSYSEMYQDIFKYPSGWTTSWNSYQSHKQKLAHHIIVNMTNYENRIPYLQKQTNDLTNNFFNATVMLNNILTT